MSELTDIGAGYENNGGEQRPELSLNEYQRSMHTYKKAHEECHALGIMGELAEVNEELAAFRAAGHIADIVKKAVSHGVSGDRSKLLKELGDVLWYIAAVANDNDITLEEIARENISKLRARYPEGFVRGGGVRERGAESSMRQDETGNTVQTVGSTNYAEPAILCEHANERPLVCPCPPNCYCRRIGSAPSCQTKARIAAAARFSEIDLRGGVPQRTKGCYFNCGCSEFVDQQGITHTTRCPDGQCIRLGRR